jgi:uncharacterized protein
MPEVREDPARRRFEMDLGEGVAFATYRERGPVVEIAYTKVPAALNGRGHGRALVKGLLDILRASDRKVAPLCPFVAHYIREHPEYQDLLA